MRNTERRTRSIGDIGVRLLLFALGAVLLMALQLTGRLQPVQSFITQLTSPAQVGATGTAIVDGADITVTVTRTQPLRILPGADRIITVTETASAVRGNDP